MLLPSSIGRHTAATRSHFSVVLIVSNAFSYFIIVQRSIAEALYCAIFLLKHLLLFFYINLRYDISAVRLSVLPVAFLCCGRRFVRGEERADTSDTIGHPYFFLLARSVRAGAYVCAHAPRRLLQYPSSKSAACFMDYQY